MIAEPRFCGGIGFRNSSAGPERERCILDKARMRLLREIRE